MSAPGNGSLEDGALDGSIGPADGGGDLASSDAPAAEAGEGGATAHGLLGVYNGGTTADVTMFESEVTGGRHVGAASYYPAFDATPSKQTFVTDMLGRGTAMVIDLSARTSAGVQPWADFASGKYDAEATAWGAFFAAVDVSKASLYVSFNWEPDTAISNGSQTSATDYVAAFQRLHGLIGTKNVRWLWGVGNSDRTLMPSLYPGDAYVDIIGADPYKWQFHTASETPQQTLAIFSWFSTQTWHGPKPYCMPETGVDATKFATGSYTAGDWWADMPAAAQLYGLAFVIAFDREADYSGLPTPDNFLIEGTASASGYLSALESTYFN